jgi:hypothetical protein
MVLPQDFCTHIVRLGHTGLIDQGILLQGVSNPGNSNVSRRTCNWDTIKHPAVGMMVPYAQQTYEFLSY